MKKGSLTETRNQPTEYHRKNGLQVDRFTLLHRLGAGGYGEAWLAVDPGRRDQHREGHVVLKFLHHHLLTAGNREQIEEDFRLSYRRIQKLIHQSICPLTELGDDPRFGPFQIMPYLSGVTLKQHLREQDPQRRGLTLSVAIPWLNRIAEALDYAHRHSIVHRDIKPCNIILNPTTGELWILDFGLAAEIRYAVSLHSDVPNTAGGTPLYMAPEQWQARPSDQVGQTDQYAAGIIAWQMLTGYVPYSAPSELLRLAVLQDPVPPLPEHLSHLQPVFNKALAKHWTGRFSTVCEFVAELASVGGLATSTGSSSTALQGVADDDRINFGSPAPTEVATRNAEPAAAGELPPEDTGEYTDEAVSGFQSISRVHAAARQLHTRGLHQQALDVLDGLPEHLRPHLDRQLHQQCTDARDQLAPLIQQATEAERSVALCRLKRVLEQLQTLQPEESTWKRKLASILSLPRSETPPGLLAPFDQQMAVAAQQMWGWHLDRTEIQSNCLGMQLTLIPPGTFQMGSPDGIGEERERPQHKVTITKPFWISTCAVTQAQWRKLMQTEPWVGKSNVLDHDDAPATWVSWNDAVEFCKRLSTADSRKYSLPTEAQWEYACRAGTTTLWSFGDDEKQLPEYAWIDRNAGNTNEKYAHRVGLKRPNPFGLYDMHGNVVEWCADAFDEKFYRRSPTIDPINAAAGGSVVCRAGSWCYSATDARSAYRYYNNPDYTGNNVGFRIVAE